MSVYAYWNIDLNEIQQPQQTEHKFYNPQMSSYERILTEFKKLGYQQDSYLQRNQANQALDAIAAQNAGFQQFDQSIAEQLWAHCSPDSTRGVKVHSLVNTILEADDILRQQIGVTEGTLKFETRPKEKAEIEEEYRQIVADHNMIAAPFRLPPLRQSLQNAENSRLLQQPAYMPSGINERQGDSVIFGYEPNAREDSATDLKICLFIAIFMMVWQLVLMFHKHHFLNLLAIFGVLSIFFLNYFDKNYMKFLLILLAASFVFDIVWLGVNAREYWNPSPQTQHSTLHTGFLIFIFIMVIILMILKIAVAGILFKYRENPQSFKKNISLFGYKIKLDGRPTYNPFSPLLRAAPNISIN